jgi:hypothetical protein
MSDELRNLINSAYSELNPQEVDNQEEAPAEEVVDQTEEVVDELVETENTESEETEEEVESEEAEESDDSNDSDGEKYTVKIDGETLEVTLDELRNGYQRQADYTRDKQALKAAVEEFEDIRKSFAEQIDAVEQLDSAWSEDPIQVLAQFTASTQNPTQAVALLIRDLAASNLLDSQFLNMFGITPDVQAEWAKEKQLTSNQVSAQRGLSQKEKQLMEAQEELAVQQAIAEYDKQIDEIIDEEGLDFNVKQRSEFRKQLAGYAADNDLTNLKAAYKAFKYEESKKQKALAKKTVEKAKAKKATSVVSRSSGSEGNSVQDTSDLNSVIRQAMKEATGN